MADRCIGAILLVAGTCIGAVTLALPVSIAPLGYLSTLAIFFVFWLMMWLSGLMVLEANLRLPESSGFISMAGATLGKWGKGISWACYLLLLYSLLAAYLSGGSDLLQGFLQHNSMLHLSHWQSAAPWVLTIALLLFYGTHHIALINRVLVGGLIITFLILGVMMTQAIDLNHFELVRPQHILPALPIMITAFGYQVIIPSMCTYLGRDGRSLRRALLWGSLIPLAVYIIWATDIFGSIPLHGPQSLDMLNQLGHPARDLPGLIVSVTSHPWLVLIVDGLIFFALASSFLGIALSLFDFLADGFKVPKHFLGRVFLAGLTILPPWLYASVYPKGFVIALSYAGIFVALLNGLLPALMVWRGRQSDQIGYRAPGRYVSVFFVALMSCAVIVAQIFGHA